VSLTASASQLAPVLVFFVAVTVVAEIADLAGVFDVAGHWTARVAGHRILVLWLLFAGLATLSTIVLSLDTTALLLTPVGLAVARQLRISPLPFALTTLWLANTASLLLPVSNLTNLLALDHFDRLGVGHVGYVRLAAGPAVAAVVSTLVVVYLLHARELSGRYVATAPAGRHEPVLLAVAGAVCLLMAVLFAGGLPPAAVASSSAAVLVVVLWWRRREAVARVVVPWRMAVVFASVFTLVTWSLRLGLEDPLGAVVGQGDAPPDLIRLTGAAALTANAINNLPAYAAFAPLASDSPVRLMALLVGVNLAPLVTPWASLANLLWVSRCHAAHVRMSPRRLAGSGLCCAVVAAGSALLVLLAMIQPTT